MSEIVSVTVIGEMVEFDMRGSKELDFFMKLNDILEKMQKKCSGKVHLYNRGENQARAVCVQEVLVE